MNQSDSAQKVTDSRALRAGVLLFLLALAVRLIFLWNVSNDLGDAWFRFEISQRFLAEPTKLPSEYWLPLHFWLLGSALWIWNSIWAARLLTAVLGALTVLPLLGIVRRLAGEDEGRAAALMLCLFGQHIAYSITTNSEAPTLFFLLLGVYGWMRWLEQSRVRWLGPAATSLIAASLCRFEVWEVLPILALFSLDFSQGLRSALNNRKALARAVLFGVAASLGAMGWMVFSTMKWGDPLAATQRTFAINQADLAQRFVESHSLLYTLAVVPGGLFTALGPVVLLLALVAFWMAFARRRPTLQSLAVLAAVMFAAHYYAAVTRNVTQVRFSLMYSWALLALAAAGSCFLSRSRLWLRALVVVFLLWQGAVSLGAYWAPAPIAEKLAMVSPSAPPRPEIRNLARWLQEQVRPDDKLIVDNFNYEAGGIVRTAGLRRSQLFIAQRRFTPPETAASLQERVAEYIRSEKPRFLIYSSGGLIGQAWRLKEADEVTEAALGVQLRRVWRGQTYVVYEIQPTPRS